MITLQGFDLDIRWLLGLAFLLGCQYLLFRILIVRQRRSLDSLLQTLDTRIRRNTELDWTELESRLHHFCEEQKQSIDDLKSRLVESELRKHTGLSRSDCPSIGRLDKRHQVMSLAQMGFDSRDISRKLRLSRGETELLLGLGEHFRRMETLDGERAL